MPENVSLYYTVNIIKAFMSTSPASVCCGWCCSDGIQLEQTVLSSGLMLYTSVQGPSVMTHNGGHDY